MTSTSLRQRVADWRVSIERSGQTVNYQQYSVPGQPYGSGGGGGTTLLVRGEGLEPLWLS